MLHEFWFYNAKTLYSRGLVNRKFYYSFKRNKHVRRTQSIYPLPSYPEWVSKLKEIRHVA